MPARLVEIPVVFYRSAAGAEPVREWLRELAAADRRAIGGDLATLQVGWPIGCRCAARLVEVFGNCEAIYLAGERHGCCSSRGKASSASCTASSRRRRRRQPAISNSHAGA